MRILLRVPVPEWHDAGHTVSKSKLMQLYHVLSHKPKGPDMLSRDDMPSREREQSREQITDCRGSRRGNQARKRTGLARRRGGVLLDARLVARVDDHAMHAAAVLQRAAAQ